MDVVCPSCGAANPAGARFCMSCGAALTTEAPATERRFVSVLFVDLVGFTERSDRADPEDVRRTLVPYHEAVKRCLERFGGTLDKFIGDAVMGVFGAPVAHEDDPVRAVDAALTIVREVGDLQIGEEALSVRVAVNTGEAMVSPGSGPQVGEAVAGDVVNTASRIQSIAPTGGVVLGEATARAVRDQIELEELPPATVKGKAEPLRVWRALRRKDPAETEAVEVAPFVGREAELDALVAAFDEAVAASEPRTVAVVGEPGMGKSRLVREVRHRLGPHAWLVARCQPYGEDVALRPAAALVESVLRAPREPSEPFDRALDVVLSEVPEQARDGIRSQIDRLFGRGAETGTLQDLAAAIALMLRREGDRGLPIVIVVEDLHWAEPVLLSLALAVRDELADRPVLFIGTSRPPLPTGGPPGPVVELGPLEPAQTTRLVHELTARFGFHETTPEAFVERSGGNPLFALEFVRELADRSAGARAAITVPETVQAMIGARLDRVPPPLRTAVHDAAVVGPEFWAPAVAALDGGDEARAVAALTDLTQRGVLTRDPPGWFPGQPTFRFAHALFREVAYARLPRESRADKHLRAGRWLEVASGDRAPERADAIAHHFEQAFQLAQRTGNEALAGEAREPTARWLNLAGDRVRGIDPKGALDRYDRALAVAGTDSRERARALCLSATMGARTGVREADEALAWIDEALALAVGIGDRTLEAWVRVRRYSQLAYMGHGPVGAPELDRAIELLEPSEDRRSLAEAYAFRAEHAMLVGETNATIGWSERALGAARESGATTFQIMALHLRGNGRCELEDPRGLDDLREARRLSEDMGDTAELVFSLSYLAEWTWLLEGPSGALESYDTAVDLSTRRGLYRQSMWSNGGSLGPAFDAGHWSDLRRRVEVFREADPSLVDPTLRLGADAWWSKAAIALGRVAEMADPEALAALGREIEEMHALAPGLSVAAMIYVARGEAERALPLLEELERATAEVESPTYREEIVADATRSAIAAGDLTLAERFAKGEGTTARSRATYATAKAAVAEAAGDADGAARWLRAADLWVAFGGPHEEALAWEGVARCSTDAGEAAAARERAAAAHVRVTP